MLSDFWEWQKKADGNDITVQALISPEQHAAAEIIAKEDGIFCGREELLFFGKQENLEIEILKKDGKKIKKGDLLVNISGNARKILGSERILLNVLGRLMGIATLTKNIANKLPSSVSLLPTRKTFWGAMEKKAIVAGGGLTHRINLESAILTKENHLLLCGGILPALEKMKDWSETNAKNRDNFFWEIEVETESEFREVLLHSPRNIVGVVMLDNFSPQEIKQLLQTVQKPKNLFFEASGGITPHNILEFADSGIDAISCGFLTHSARSADVSLRVVS